MIKRDCVNLEDCLKYSAMTLDNDAVSCHKCSAYQSSGERRMSNVVLGENMEVLCPCGAGMRKLYWVYPSQHQPDRIVFTSWFGCTDCGKYIYDKREDVYLHSSGETAK